MIIDTHFHAFPGKFLDLIPEAQNDVRGVGFHAFDHREYLDVINDWTIEVFAEGAAHSRWLSRIHSGRA